MNNFNVAKHTISKLTCTNSQVRFMGTGTRGARGHGWLNKYRSNLGGRHLQGRHHNRNTAKLTSINDQVFGLNQTHASKVDTPNQVYLDFSIQGEESAGPHRVIIELASAALPNTCKNFVALCQAERNGYKSSRVYRILPEVGLCLGDSTERNNGKQGKCSPTVVPENAPPNTNTFAHEATVLSHAQEGIVTMLSTGLDKNDSRFLIMTADDAPHLDGKMVAFGRVKEGLNALQNMVKTIYTKKGQPTVNIEIVDCGAM